MIIWTYDCKYNKWCIFQCRWWLTLIRLNPDLKQNMMCKEPLCCVEYFNYSHSFNLLLKVKNCCHLHCAVIYSEKIQLCQLKAPQETVSKTVNWCELVFFVLYLIFVSSQKKKHCVMVYKSVCTNWIYASTSSVYTRFGNVNATCLQRLHVHLESTQLK